MLLLGKYCPRSRPSLPVWLKPQILGLYVCKKKTFPFAFDGVYCFAFDLLHVFFLHIGVNLPDSVKNSVLLGIRPPRSVQHVAIVESVKK